MPNSGISFGVIGAGSLARAMHIPNILRMPNAKLHACCDLDEKALQECARLAPGVVLSKDFRAVINDPAVDVLVVATTENFRIPIIAEIARARKAVYCEKPLARNLEEALKIQDLVRESGIPFCVGHNRRCSPAMEDAQRIFSSHMKEPKPCPWRYSRDGLEGSKLQDDEGMAGISIIVNDDWRSWKSVHLEGQNAEIGLLLSENTHFVDIACWFLQAKPTEVTTSFTGILLHQVTIKFEGGHLASIMSCANGSFGYPKEFYQAMGRGGVVVVDHMLEVRTAGIEAAPLIQVYPMLGDRHVEIGSEGGHHGWLKKKQAACNEATRSGRSLDQFTAEPDKGHARMLSEFVREIRGERSPVSPVEDAVRAVQVCVAAVKSKRENRPVLLKEVALEAERCNR